MYKRQVSDLQARRAQGERGVSEAATRLARLDQQLADLKREKQGLTSPADSEHILALRKAYEAAKGQASAAEARALAAETMHQRAREAEAASRPPLQEAERYASRLETEAKTLAKLVLSPPSAPGRGHPMAHRYLRPMPRPGRSRSRDRP